jgi:hypothetical protein
MPISIGDVLYLHCGLCNPPKMKFFVVARTQPLWMFLINSNLTVFALSKPRYIDACPVLRRAEHAGFLTHDSYLGCDQRPSHEYNDEQIEKKLQSDPAVRVGRLSNIAIAEILASLKTNRLVPRKYLNELVPLWQQVLESGNT